MIVARHAKFKAGRLLVAVLALASSPALAQDDRLCLPEGQEQLADAPQDMGHGMIWEHLYAGSVAGVADPVVLFTDCASGVKIAAALPQIDGTRRVPADLVTVMERALTSDANFTARQVADAMSSIGAPAQVRQSTREACGCAHFYPDLRGDKTPWVAP